jgi:UDP-N-acetylglucosamine 2-epimerase (non-hydrolysing)
MHPRTKKRIQDFRIKVPAKIKIIDPVGYLEMLILMQNAAFILTDSGGIQEEACTLQIPCITMRESTKRPESIEVGANVLSGTNMLKILEETDKILRKKHQKWKNPFGNGKTSEEIIKFLI